MFRLYIFTLVAALAACRTAPASTTLGPGIDSEVRLARVEQRLNKLVTFLQKATQAEAEIDRTVTYAIPIDPIDPSTGPADAKVTIIEGYEFLCPYCARMAPVLEELVAKYPKDVRIISKYLVVHPPAAALGRAACAAAKQGKYTAMTKALWTGNWQSEESEPDPERKIEEGVKVFAKQVGLNDKRFDNDRDGADCKGWLDRSAEVLGRFGARGTPAFFMNGRFIGHGMSLAQLTTFVDAEIGAVTAAMAKGVPAGKYYDQVVMKDGASEAKMILPFE